MVIQTNKNSILDFQKKIHKKGGIVILDLKEYKKLLKYEMEQENIDKLVKEGLKEEKEGKTESMENFLKREYPNLYGQYCKS